MPLNHAMYSTTARRAAARVGHACWSRHSPLSEAKKLSARALSTGIDRAPGRERYDALVGQRELRAGVLATPPSGSGEDRPVIGLAGLGRRSPDGWERSRHPGQSEVASSVPDAPDNADGAPHRHHLGILEHQVTVGARPEVRLPPAEDDRHDVDRHDSMSPSDSACPPTSPAPTPISPSPASSCARAIPSSTEVAK